MRRNILIAGLCVAGLMCAAPSSVAFSGDLGVRDHGASDVSAAKKKKHRQYVYVRRAPQAAYARGPMDPSLGPDGRPYPNPYPPGTCSIDLGYGRFGNCDHRR